MSQAPAVVRARTAHLGAHSAGRLVMTRHAKHEVGADPTDIGTVHQHCDVGWIGVRATEREAVPGGTEAGRMASLAFIDA